MKKRIIMVLALVLGILPCLHAQEGQSWWQNWKILSLLGTATFAAAVGGYYYFYGRTKPAAPRGSVKPSLPEEKISSVDDGKSSEMIKKLTDIEDQIRNLLIENEDLGDFIAGETKEEPHAEVSTLVKLVGKYLENYDVIAQKLAENKRSNWREIFLSLYKSLIEPAGARINDNYMEDLHQADFFNAKSTSLSSYSDAAQKKKAILRSYFNRVKKDEESVENLGYFFRNVVTNCTIYEALLDDLFLIISNERGGDQEKYEYKKDLIVLGSGVIRTLTRENGNSLAYYNLTGTTVAGWDLTSSIRADQRGRWAKLPVPEGIKYLDPEIGSFEPWQFQKMIDFINEVAGASGRVKVSDIIITTGTANSFEISPNTFYFISRNTLTEWLPGLKRIWIMPTTQGLNLYNSMVEAKTEKGEEGKKRVADYKVAVFIYNDYTGEVKSLAEEGEPVVLTLD